MSILRRCCRIAVQLVSFALFGLGGLLLGTVVYPLVWILPISAASKTDCIQKVIHKAFRLFLWFVETAQFMEFRFEGEEQLAVGGGGLVIANHPTLLDVVFLISRLPQADCVVKKELWNNFFLRSIVASAGYISNDDGPALAEAAMKRVKQGRKVILFPEGTRSLPDGLKPFNKGFAHIAVRAECSLWPVVMTCKPSALTKGRSVFSIPEQRARLTAVAGKPIDPKTYYDSADSAAIAVRKVTASMQHYFEERIDYGKHDHA